MSLTVDEMAPRLTTADHSRDAAGLKYVYPVISRRAGGLSVGINFNTDNACNWRCIYCQVPDLKRGSAPPPDFDRLRRELTDFLQYVLHGSFYEDYRVDEGRRVIRDIAISGNGEPTSLKEFDKAISIISDVVSSAGIPNDFNVVLITNGSLMRRQSVRRGLALLNEIGGRVWFKLDSATPEGRIRINNAAISQERVIGNLTISASLCQTWLQTCLLDFDGRGFERRERLAYLDLLRKLKGLAEIRGVLLYTTARPPLQPEAGSIRKLPLAVLESFAREIEELGFEVSVSD
ncbi:MAG: radical SAM protein [Gammaproteobacteria bacterium]